VLASEVIQSFLKNKGRHGWGGLQGEAGKSTLSH